MLTCGISGALEGSLGVVAASVAAFHSKTEEFTTMVLHHSCMRTMKCVCHIIHGSSCLMLITASNMEPAQLRSMMTLVQLCIHASNGGEQATRAGRRSLHAKPLGACLSHAMVSWGGRVLRHLSSGQACAEACHPAPWQPCCAPAHAAWPSQGCCYWRSQEDQPRLLAQI